MRNDHYHYAWFADEVLSFIVGRKVYKERCKTELMMQWATVSDEALGLVLLENSWQYWNAQFIIMRRQKDGEEYEPEDGNFPMPRYSISHNSNGKAKHQWTEAGMKKYGYYYQEVKQNRAENGGRFDRWYLEEKRKSTKTKRKEKKVKEDTSSFLVPVDYDSDTDTDTSSAKESV